MTFEKYVELYERTGKLPFLFSSRKRPYSESELRRKYDRYVTTIERQQQKRAEGSKNRELKIDEEWERTKNESAVIYGRHCLLLGKLPNVVRGALLENSGGLHKIVDPAHIFPKGAFPHMKYVAENVIPLNRYSHSMLDQQCDPVTGKQITSKEVVDWWKYLVGDKTYLVLKTYAENR